MREKSLIFISMALFLQKKDKDIQGMQKVLSFVPPSPSLASYSLDIWGRDVVHSCHYSSRIPLSVISLREISTEVNLQILFFQSYFMPVEMRSVIYFLWLKNLTIDEISREVDDVYGQSAPCLRTVQRLMARFAAGEEGLEDRPRNGPLRSDQNIDFIVQLLVNDPDISQKVIAEILSIHQATVKWISLEELSLQKVNFKSIYYHLNEGQMQEIVRVSMELLEFLDTRELRDLANIYTGDETRVCYDNPWS
jgi:hypothetical protein